MIVGIEGPKTENPNLMIVDIGGCDMDPYMLWNLFLDTGAPELYLLYVKALREAEPATA